MSDHNTNPYQRALDESARERARTGTNTVVASVVVGLMLLSIAVFALIGEVTVAPGNLTDVATGGLAAGN